MSLLLDTSVVIHLRDRQPDFVRRAGALTEVPYLAIVGRVELENDVYRDAALAAPRRAALDLLTANFVTLDFGQPALQTYRGIIDICGYARARTMDRMIAATALANGLALATVNSPDFQDIPDLDLQDWSDTATRLA